jgi:outer membrane protein assembly factor BamD
MKKLKLYLLAFLFLAACGGKSDIIEVRPMDELFQVAYENVDKKNWEEASGLFLEIEAAYGATKWAPEALTMAAYTQYMNKDFAATLSTIDRFMRFHPGHENAAYMLYLRGMTFYRQVSDVRREIGMSQHALVTFMQLTQRFPNSE